MISIIACIDIEGGLGDENGNLLFDLPNDLEHFKSTTRGKTVVMGRKTWESLPKKPLKNRKNVILTNSLTVGELTLYKEYDEEIEVLTSIDDVLKLAETEHVFIIGGGNVYSQFMEYADELILTHVHTISDKAVTFFPNIDISDWKLVKVSENLPDEKHAFKYVYAYYSRKK